MNRRDFFPRALAALAVLPAPAIAQRGDRPKRIGLLLSQAEGNNEGEDRIGAIRDGLSRAGWAEGRDYRFIPKFAAGNAQRLRANAIDLAREEPDVIVASASSALAAAKAATSRIPIVFAQVTDPVGAGFVASLARPGGNITGFTQHEFSIGVKWIELLIELAPATRRFSVLFDPQNPATSGYITAMVATKPRDVEIETVSVRTTDDIETAMARFGAMGNTGLVVLPGPAPSVHAALVTRLCTRHRIPAIYPFRYWVNEGGLAFYGVDNIDLHRRAATYVDRILKGARPEDLPIQNASRFEFVVNLRAARSLGIEIAPAIIARADEVVE